MSVLKSAGRVWEKKVDKKEEAGMASIECGSFERAGPFLCKLVHQGSDGTTYQYDFYDVTKLGATYRRYVSYQGGRK